MEKVGCGLVLEGWKPRRLFKRVLREGRGVSQAGKKQELDHRKQREALVEGERASWSGQNRGVSGVHMVSRTDSLTGEAGVCELAGLSCVKPSGSGWPERVEMGFPAWWARCSVGENWSISAWFGTRQEQGYRL